MPERIDDDDALIARVRWKLKNRFQSWKLPDGTDLMLQVEPLTFGRARLIVTDGRSTVEQFWEYDSIMLAQIAGLLWEENDFEYEPKGWRRAHKAPLSELPAGFRRTEDFWTDEDGIRMLAENESLCETFMERDGMPFPMATDLGEDLCMNPVMLLLAIEVYRRKQREGEDDGER